MWTLGFLCVLFLFALLIRGNMNLLGGLLVLVFLLVVSLRDRILAAILGLAYLCLLGDLRRIMDVSFGHPVLDLLLLVGPCFAFIMAVPILLKLRLTDSLSKAMTALMLIMIIEVINPQQGGLAVGLSGTVFYLAPVFWFWVAREYASPSVIRRLLYYGLFPLTIAAAILGLCQTFIGFLPYQQAWIEIVGKTYHALYVGKSVRPFGFSVSSAEYATLLAIGAAGTAAAFFGRQRLWSSALMLLIPALILSSSRALVLKFIVALAVVWTFRRGNELKGAALVRVVGLAVGGLVAVSLIAAHYAPSQSSNSQSGSSTQNLIGHQAGGLAHPFDKHYSTAGLHGGMLMKGIVSGFTDPIGHGLGATTLGGKKLGDSGDSTTSSAGSSEVDFSDMFIDLGFIGGFIYIFIIYSTVRAALAYITRVELGVGLPVLAILTLTLAAWLIGGQYSTSSILFFLIGGVAYGGRPESRPRSAPIEVAQEVFS